MDNQALRQLIRSYIDGTCTAEERLWVESWYKNQSEQDRSGLAEEQIAAAQQQIWEKLQPPRTRSIMPVWKIAAAVLFLLGTGYLLYLLLSALKQDWKDMYAEGNIPCHLQLPDGSELWLNAGSHLRYPATFKGNERRVELVSGEVCVHATEDATRPFIITSGHLHTRVLGTIFNVRSYAGLPFVQVSVQEGKVAVTQDGDANAMILLPDERATLYTGIKDLVKDTVEAAAISGWTTDQLLFNNERLDMIAVLLENKYNVHISFADTTLSAYKVTAGFAANDSIQEVLEALSLANNLTYNRKGNNIVFNKRSQ